MKVTPTQRTLKYYRNLGYICGITEKWNPHVKIRQDLFGFIDIIAMSPSGSTGIIAIQCTSGTNHAARKKKIVEKCTDSAMAWLKNGGRIIVISWNKQKKVRNIIERMEQLKDYGGKLVWI